MEQTEVLLNVEKDGIFRLTDAAYQLYDGRTYTGMSDGIAATVTGRSNPKLLEVVKTLGKLNTREGLEQAAAFGCELAIVKIPTLLVPYANIDYVDGSREHIVYQDLAACTKALLANPTLTDKQICDLLREFLRSTD